MEQLTDSIDIPGEFNKMKKFESEDEISNINDAWNCKRYDIVLALLEEDSDFPTNFNVIDLNDGTEDQKSLLGLIETRHGLHDLIKKGDFEKIKAFSFKKKLKYYLNTKNESAVYTAITNKQFQIYAYLKSVGAEFRNNHEQSTFDGLEFSEKSAVTDALVNYFTPVSHAHIHYLISKSRSQQPMDNLEETVKDYYYKLENIPEISIILRIIQYSDFLDIIFDFNNDNVAPVSPTSTKNTKGETRYKEGRLYIAAGSKRSESEILGTIAHELTHMAMEIIYKNDCNPYCENEEFKFEKTRKNCRNISSTDGGLSNTLLETFQYQPQDFDSELIARVPHITAQYSNGKIWLILKARELWNYYNEVVLADCEKFIRQSFVLKSKNQIRRMNERIGEIKNVKKFDIYFRKVSKIKNFLHDESRKVFLIIGDNTFLSVLKVLQALFDKTYVKKYDNYLVLKFKAYTQQPLTIIKEFYLEGCDVLIVENIKNLENFMTSDGMNLLKELLKSKPNKKIIFTASREEDLKVNEKLQKTGLIYSCFSDKTLSLSHLGEKSQQKILDKEIFFQEKRMRLTDLIKNDESLRKLIDAKTIVDLMKGKQIEIGTKALGMANLEGAYGDLLEEINIQSFIKEIKKSTDIFLFDGLEGSNKIEQLISILKDNLDVKTESEKPQNIRKKLSDASRAIFVENFTDKKFKEFCQQHPQQEIYWIKVGDSSLTLQQLYNFNFYLDRKFVFYEKLFVRKEALINKSNGFIFPELLLISNANRESFIDLYDCPDVETKQKFEKILDKMRPIFIESEKNARVTFEMLVKSSNTSIHWLKKEEDKLIWKNSHGPLQNIRKCIDKNSSEKSSVSEKDLIKKIINNDVVIIADDPGMGKTTTLTKLYDTKFDSQTIIDSHWVIRINFKDHLQAIKNIDLDNMSIKEMIKFFSETNPNLKTNLAKGLLTYVLDSKCDFSKPLLLSFDGFDELLDESDRNKIIASLKFLKEKTKSKIWITTRLHYKELLENNLSTFAIEFEPIDDCGKEEFIKKYLRNRLKLILSTERFENIFVKKDEDSKSQIIAYTKKFIKNMENIFANDMTRFIGTPLQLYLMLEGILEHFKRDYQNEKWNFSYLGNNIMEVYKNFINKKYNIYYKKVKSDVMLFTLKQIKVVYNMYHKQLAKILILNSTSNKSLEHLQNIILSCGIIKYQEGSLEFIHQTFGEYFAAKIIFNWIKEDKKYPCRYNKIEHVLQKILLKPDYKLIRSFLNFRINKINTEMLPKENLKRFGTVMSNLLKNKEANNKTFMDVIIQEEHLNILNFAITALRNVDEDFLQFTSHLGDPILIYACRCNKINVVKYLLTKTSTLTKSQQYKLLSKRGKSDETCLHHAALYNNVEIVKLILDRAKKVTTSRELEEFLSMKDINNNTVLHLATSFIGKFYTDCDEMSTETPLKTSEFSYLKSEQYLTPEKPYELLSVNLYENIDRLYSTGQNNLPICADSSAAPNIKNVVKDLRENYKSTVLDIVRLILDLLSAYKIYDLLCAANANKLNVLHLASVHGHYSLVQFLLRKFEEIIFKEVIKLNSDPRKLTTQEKFQEILLSENVDGRNSLQMAAIFGHSKVTFMLFNKIPPRKKYETVCMKDCSRSNIMHQVASKGHCNPVKVIFNELKEIADHKQIRQFLLAKNEDGNTALHIAAEKGHLKLMRNLIECAVHFSAQDPYVLITAQGSDDASVIHRAVSFGRLEVAKFLMDMIQKEKIYSTLSLTDVNSKNVLHTAALQENCEMVKLVIKKLQDTLSPQQMQEFFFLQTNEGDNVLRLAARNSNLAVTKFLIKYASNISDQNFYDLITTKGADEDLVIHRAVGFGKIEVASFLLDMIPDDKVYSTLTLTNKYGHTVLHMAAFQENIDFVKLVIKKLEESLSEELIQQFFALKTNEGDNVLRMAAGTSNLAVTKYLLEYAAKVSGQDVYDMIIPKKMDEESSVIHRAVGFGRIEVATYLLNMIPKEKVYSTFSLTNSKGNNILHMATFQENCDIVELVLKRLEEALTKEQIKQFFFLQTPQGNNALHIAVVKSNLAVMKFLLDYAAKISNEDKHTLIITKGTNEGTVIHKAVGFGRIEVVRFLLDMIPKDQVQSTLRLTDKNGNNVLHYAANQENREFVEVVVKKLVEELPPDQTREFLYLENLEGCTAIRIAKKRAYLDVETYLSQIQKVYELTQAQTPSKTRKPSNAFKYATLRKKIFF